MNVQKWLAANTAPLAGQRVALTGATGGLGRELCFYLAGLGAELILLDRSREKGRRWMRRCAPPFRRSASGGYLWS